MCLVFLRPWRCTMPMAADESEHTVTSTFSPKCAIMELSPLVSLGCSFEHAVELAIRSAGRRAPDAGSLPRWPQVRREDHLRRPDERSYSEHPRIFRALIGQVRCAKPKSSAPWCLQTTRSRKIEQLDAKE